MLLFANEFSMNEIGSQPASQIPRYTLVEIMHKSKTNEEILFYINATHVTGGKQYENKFMLDEIIQQPAAQFP